MPNRFIQKKSKYRSPCHVSLKTSSIDVKVEEFLAAFRNTFNNHKCISLSELLQKTAANSQIVCTYLLQKISCKSIFSLMF
jgi:hypothetical protein